MIPRLKDYIMTRTGFVNSFAVSSGISVDASSAATVETLTISAKVN